MELGKLTFLSYSLSFSPSIVHFEPTGHSLRHNARVESGGDVAEKYRRSVEKRTGGHEGDHDGLPSYIQAGSPEERHWRAEHGMENPVKKPRSFGTGSSPVAHEAAQAGDAAHLKHILDRDEDLVHAKDENGWQPIHEGARGGHQSVVELLVEKGANINERANFGEGGTPLWYAQQEGHSVIIDLLEELGALSIGPDL